jgi:hypothetical protein
LYEAKNDAFHTGKYKLMAMFGEEIERREVTQEEDEEEIEEVAA